MRIASILATAAIVVTCGSASVQARSSANAVPAEFPPASFTGKQYVDTKGCVFIRAGIDGAVTWVPRMSRARKQICGMQPSLSSTQVATAQAPRATAATATATPPRAAAPRVAPTPAPVRARAAAPAAIATPAPPVAARPDAPPRVVTVVVPRSAAVSCAGASPLSRQYIGAGRGYAVRCGPQSAPHVTEKATASASATIYDPAHARPAMPYAGNSYAAYPGVAYPSVSYAAAPVMVAPRHVYAAQLASRSGIHVPPGYAPVWDDDRLNPRRAHQTLSGKAQMDGIWTRTTPRQLIPADPGPVVTRASSRSYHVSAAMPAPVNAARVSTRGAAPQPQAQPEVRPGPEPGAATSPASHRYVQLGAFTDPAHARRTAQQIANSGLPARMGGVTRNGTSYTLVLAGPFETQQGLERGLSRVRGMGFGQAVLRR